MVTFPNNNREAKELRTSIVKLAGILERLMSNKERVQRTPKLITRGYGKLNAMLSVEATYWRTNSDF